MSKLGVYLLIIVSTVLMTFHLETALGNTKAQTVASEPTVVMAVAPTFVPFVLGQTGTAKIVVEVQLDPKGEVVAAQIVEGTFRSEQEEGKLTDRSFENAAKRWRFAPAVTSKTIRKTNLVFILSILPKDTPLAQLTTIYTAPYQMEVRHKVFDPTIDSDPRPEKPRKRSE